MLMFAVAEDRMSCAPMPTTQLAKLGILETSHLERWVVDHPEVLGDNIRIVTTQYNKWSSDYGDLAKERLDILGLDASGQLVVVELKRGTDSNVHMQAITYAALVAGFSKETLADAHAEYLNRDATTRDCTPADASELLNDHVDGTWDDDVLTVPKIVLLAEDFTAQTYTTVMWLSNLTPTLNIEMHTVNAFLTDGGQPCAVFRRLFPVVDPSTRVLTPGIATTNATSVATKIAENKRRSRSTYLLHDRGTIPEGTEIILDLHGCVDATIVTNVEAWVSQNPTRGRAVWINNRQKPLRWLGTETDETFTPSRLTQRIISEATGHWKGSINGSDVWKWHGQSLYELATKAEASINTEPNLESHL
ncbi:DNA-binding protein [Mycobacteroides abscessus]|uniref:DNA-binding protein n=1 Tax=Mycobacteroides abscessus TaxID=36809 RepID=UPI002670A510|nr:DNA-binding protein [Mycobacteroides abscessus]MDO3110004.1 DNA-binding protein [Mycobacteroides abscessus subsp. abscessus]